MKKDIDLSKYTKAIANTIREAVRKLLALLGGTDTSGVTTFLINTLKNIARELRDFLNMDIPLRIVFRFLNPGRCPENSAIR
jgi:hypothetical protein